MSGLVYNFVRIGWRQMRIQEFRWGGDPEFWKSFPFFLDLFHNILTILGGCTSPVALPPLNTPQIVDVVEDEYLEIFFFLRFFSPRECAQALSLLRFVHPESARKHGRVHAAPQHSCHICGDKLAKPAALRQGF